MSLSTFLLIGTWLLPTLVNPQEAQKQAAQDASIQKAVVPATRTAAPMMCKQRGQRRCSSPGRSARA